MTATPALAAWSRDALAPLPDRVEHLRQLGHLNEYAAAELLALLRPAGRKRHLYRVTAVYAANPRDPDSATYERTRHFQTKGAALAARVRLLRGFEAGIGEDAYTVPAARSVTIEQSEPVLWSGVTL